MDMNIEAEKPGFRFDPTDYELMKDYLIPKLNGEPFWTGIIREDMDVYRCQPSDIPGIKTRSNFAYFFTTRDRKHKKGSRPDRCTKDCRGSWKMTSKINRIYDEEDKKVVLGYKNTLVYYLKDPTNNNKQAKVRMIKTNWIMHEFVAAETQYGAFESTSSSSRLLDGIVLCRIYERIKIRKEEKQNNDPTETNEQACDIEDPPMPMSMEPPIDMNPFIAWYEENYPKENQNLQVDNIESNIQLPNNTSSIGGNVSSHEGTSMDMENYFYYDAFPFR